MHSRHALRAACALAAALLACASAANAQSLFRTYLAPTGNDGNPCSLPQPCRLLPAALAAVADGGEIWMLETANYNAAPVNIAKSVTILAVPGALGSVVATGGNAINIATPGVSVTLRNLVIVPLPGGGGQSGIFMTAGAALAVEKCHLARLAGSGIFVGSAATVRVVDTTIADTASSSLVFNDGVVATVLRTIVSGSGQHGLFASASGAQNTHVDVIDSTIGNSALNGIRATNGAQLAVVGSRLTKNGSGIVASASVASFTQASVTDSLISQSGGVGVLAEATAASSHARITVTRSTISKASTGLFVTASNGGEAQVMVGASTIAHTADPWIIAGAGAVIKTLGNNHVDDNGGAGIGTPTPLAPR